MGCCLDKCLINCNQGKPHILEHTIYCLKGVSSVKNVYFASLGLEPAAII